MDNNNVGNDESKYCSTQAKSSVATHKISDEMSSFYQNLQLPKPNLLRDGSLSRTEFSNILSSTLNNTSNETHWNVSTIKSSSQFQQFENIIPTHQEGNNTAHIKAVGTDTTTQCTTSPLEWTGSLKNILQENKYNFLNLNSTPNANPPDSISIDNHKSYDLQVLSPFKGSKLKALLPERNITGVEDCIDIIPKNLLMKNGVSSVQCANINSFVSSNGHGRTEIVPTVQNVVSAVNLNLKLDLKEIAKVARNTEYNPKRFHALIMRIREPRTTALVFATGKLVCTGAKSEEDSKLASRKFARIIQKLGFDVSFQGYKIHNIVGSCDVRFPIRLESFQLLHANFSHYEPELFPGLVYRMVKPKVVMLIFASGKVVITGAKIRENLFKAFENILPILKEFQKIVKNKDDLKDFKQMLKNL